MVKMIAIGTIGRSEVVRKPGTDGPLDKGVMREEMISPSAAGQPPKEFEASEDEAKALESSGAAVRADKYKKDQAEAEAAAKRATEFAKPAENTAERGPHSGATSVPDSEVVGERAAAGGVVSTVTVPGGGKDRTDAKDKKAGG